MTVTVRVDIPEGIGECKAAFGVVGIDYGYIALRDNGVIQFVKGSTSNGGKTASEELIADKNISAQYDIIILIYKIKISGGKTVRRFITAAGQPQRRILTMNSQLRR